MDITKLELTELLDKKMELGHQLEEVQAGLKVISDEILSRLDAEKLSGMVVNDYSISKATRYSFKTPLEWCVLHGAVKQAPDSKILKEILLSGVDVPESNKTEYVLVKQIEHDVS